MAITGSGISAQDPYMVHTYDELVSAASESGKFIKLANDINITDEYPDGDMPTLVITANIDGDNKTISNWYKTSGNYVIQVNSTGIVTNLTFGNLYTTIRAISIDGNTISDYHFKNCNFRGIIKSEFFRIINDSQSDRNFSGCSFKLQANMFEDYDGGWNPKHIGIKDCYLDIQTPSANDTLFHNNLSGNIIGSYIKCNCKLGAESHFSNCVCEIHNDETYTISGDTSADKNIFNKGFAPNASAGNSAYIEVPADKWLDVNYLSGAGFNAG